MAKKKKHTPELKLHQNRGSWVKNDPNLLRIGGGDPKRKPLTIQGPAGKSEKV